MSEKAGGAVAELEKAVVAFEKVQRKHAKLGAGDTEPEYQFHNALRHAVQGRRQVPVTAGQWELFDEQPGAEGAARELRRACERAVDVVLEARLADRPELIRFLRGYCWRVVLD